VTATYEDQERQGTGARCSNDAVPGQQGFPRRKDDHPHRRRGAWTSGRRNVALAPGSPGDDDGFADAGETIDMTVTLRNKSGLDLDDVVVGPRTTDPKIAVHQRADRRGRVRARTNADFTTPAFRFKVAGAPTVQRTDVDQISVRTSPHVRSNKFDTSRG
jgi:hypothetical protein